MHKTVTNLIQIHSEIKEKIKELKYTNYNPIVIAVSKTFDIKHISHLIDFGHLHYGENKVQEALEKWTVPKQENSLIKLHMVGKLQTNKVRHAVKIFDYLWDIIDLIWFSSDEIKKRSIDTFSYDYDKVFIDRSKSPVFIENSALVEPFTILRGPIYMGHTAIIKSHSSITNSIIGPGCKIAEKISSSTFQSNTNKTHYGYIGNSFIGEWVNLGAGTTTSNLKNNYKNISVMINGKLIRSKK